MPATCTNLTLDLPGTWWAILVYVSRYMGPATLTRLMLNLQGTNVGEPLGDPVVKWNLKEVLSECISTVGPRS